MDIPSISDTQPAYGPSSPGNTAPMLKKDLIRFLSESIAGGDSIETIKTLFERYGIDTIEATPELPARLFEGKNLEKFRGEQLCKEPEGTAIREFLKNVAPENQLKLLQSLFEYPAQQPGVGSCARSSVMINLWINNPLEYLKLAKQCLENPDQIKFNIHTNGQAQEFTVPTGITPDAGVSLNDTMECALSCLSAQLDADGKVDTLKSRLSKLVGYCVKQDQDQRSKYRKCMQDLQKVIQVQFDRKTGEFNVISTDDGKLQGLCKDISSTLDGGTPEAIFENIQRSMAECSGKGISFKYIDFVSTPKGTQTIEFTRNESETYMTLNQAQELIGALAQDREGKSVVLANIQTIDSSNPSSPSGPGHGFNVKANITSFPGQWRDGAILNIGLSNYRDAPNNGRPYVGLRKLGPDRFDIVNYHPDQDRKKQAEPMAGTSSLKVSSITIRDVNFLSQPQ
jgi:hypothetical protein